MLSIKNLTKTYEDAAVVDDVTIDLPPGKVISLIGPNGAGKSTVLGMISRLIARHSRNRGIQRPRYYALGKS